MTPSSEGLDLFKILMQSHPVSKAVFALLIGCSLLALAVILERAIVIRRARQAVTEGLAQLDAWAAANQWDEARNTIANSQREKSPLLAVLRSGISYWHELIAVGENRLEVMEALVHDQVNRELRLVRSMLRANLTILANITSVAPFIGLFGTVVGIILTFDAISRTGNMGQELVASGIADALVATAMGLFAAIPSVLAYNYFADKVGQIVLSMEEVAMERIYFLVQREQIQTNGSSPVLPHSEKTAKPALTSTPVGKS